MDNRIQPSGPGQISEYPSAELDQPQFATVQNESSLAQVADRYGILLEFLLAENPDVDPEDLKPGQQIKLPQAQQQADLSAVQNSLPEPIPDVAPRASASKMGEMSFDGQMREMQMQRMMAGDTSVSPTPYETAAPAGSVEAAEANLATNFEEVKELGQRIADTKGPISDADKQAWVDGQAKIRKSVTELAASLSSLPLDAPERAAAKAQMEQLSKQLSSQELTVLAKTDPNFGKTWDHFHSTEKNSEGAVLPKRMKMYGITEEQMQNYIATGEEPEGMKKALADAQRRGEWPALGVIQAAYQMRADYLRATMPGDATTAKMATNLDAAAKNLANNRAAIQLNWGEQTVAKLNNKYPPDKRTVNVQKQIDEAKGAITSVRQDAVDKINRHPERYGNNSPTRHIAADALNVEAEIMTDEGTAAMQTEAKKIAEDAKKNNVDLKKVTLEPPGIPDELKEGGAVDQKRTEAVKIDPSIGDIRNGGDRAVRFVRDGHQLDRLRVGNAEQQIAHVASTGGTPSPDSVANVNKKLESIFKDELAIHDKLRHEPGSLSVSQAQFLGELDNDLATDSAKISAVWNQKQNVDGTNRAAQANVSAVARQKENLEKLSAELDKSKIDRVRKELLGKGMGGQMELALFNQNPAAYIKDHDIADNKQEAKMRADITDGFTAVARDSVTAQKMAIDAAKAQAYSQQVDDLDGLNTDAEMITGLAKDAIKESEAKLKEIPASGPERLPRLQAALNHDAAVVSVNNVIRNNSDERIGRAGLSHQEVQLVESGYPPVMGQDPVGKSKEYVDKVTAEETAIKKEAFGDAKTAAADSDNLRKQIGAELDTAQAKLPKNVQQQRAGEIQQYKDSLALQQVQTQAVVADLGADLDPKAASTELARGNQIIQDELPTVYPSHTDSQQAKLDHTRNEMRSEALAILGNTATGIADRAQTVPGLESDKLVTDALATASQSAMHLRDTVTIDSGGISSPESKEVQEALTAQSKNLDDKVKQINDSADPTKFIEALEAELPKDVGDFNDEIAEMKKVVDSREFGYFFRAGGWLATGDDVQDVARDEGESWIKYGMQKGEADTRRLSELAQTVRTMKAQHIPNHTIMAMLRDPRMQMGMSKDPKQFEQFQQLESELGKFGKDYGVNLSPDVVLRTSRAIAETPLGRAIAGMNSNKTDGLTSFVKNRYTDLLADARPELQKAFENTQETWSKAAPIAALSQVMDQVVFSAASSAAFAGVFARIATLTKIPQIFSAARGLASGMSLGGKIATLGAINLAEAGVGMLAGKAVSGIGSGIFGEGSTGAKIFDFVGSGLQLSVGSKVALQKGLGFQAALGFTMGGIPIAAQQLGMDPAMAEKLGTAVGLFVPTVLGTIGNHATLKRAEGVMVHELGLDPKQARGLMGDVFHAESMAHGEFDVESFTRERAMQLIEKRFPQLGGDARSTIADTMTLDAVRRSVPLDVDKSASPKVQLLQVNAYFDRMQGEMVKRGVSPERAREIVNNEKTAMYQDALDTTRDLMGAGPSSGADADTPNSAVANTREAIQQVENGADKPLREIHLLRTVEEGGRPKQIEETGYELIRIDHSNKSAIVKGPDGKISEVAANDVVFVHDAQALGKMPPAVEANYEVRLKGLDEKQQTAFSNMLGEAFQHSQEHVELLRKMFASGASLEHIQQWHDWAKTVPHDVLGAYVNPGLLPQHLAKACVAACAQRIEALLYPDIGFKLQDPKEQLAGQREILQRNQRAYAVRTDSAYPYRDAPPLGGLAPWTEAQPNPHINRPAALDAALSLDNHSDYSMFKLEQLDRRYLPDQLAEVADGGTAYLHLEGLKSDAVYELRGVRTENGVKEIGVLKPGSKDVEWTPLDRLMPDKNGNVFLDGHILTDVAVPPNKAMKAADEGMLLDLDPQIQNMVEAATGKKLERHEIEGEPALRAIYDSVKDIGFAGVGVAWKKENGDPSGAKHQLIVMSANEHGGKYSFDVFEPWTGTTRKLSGEELLHYKSESETYRNGKAAEAELYAVQVPKDMKLPGQITKTDDPYLNARQHIVNAEPHKLPTMKEIQKLPDGAQRQELMQILRKERNPDRLNYLENALQKGGKDLAEAAQNLKDPKFVPPSGGGRYYVLSLLDGKNASEIDALLKSQLPEFNYLNSASRNNIVSLFESNPSDQARTALFEMVPALREMPDEVRNYALEQLNNMMPQDLPKVAEKLRENLPEDWRLMGDDDAMKLAVNIFGG